MEIEVYKTIYNNNQRHTSIIVKGRLPGKVVKAIKQIEEGLKEDKDASLQKR